MGGGLQLDGVGSYKSLLLVMFLSLLIVSSGCLGGEGGDKGGDEGGEIDEGVEEGEGEQINPSQLFAEGKDLVKAAKKKLNKGRDAIYNGNYQEAQSAFAEANNKFEGAKNNFKKVSESKSSVGGVSVEDAIELADLYLQGTDKIEGSVKAYLNGDNQTASQLGDEAREFMSQASDYSLED